jgi:hypothetical protein
MTVVWYLLQTGSDTAVPARYWGSIIPNAGVGSLVYPASFFLVAFEKSPEGKAGS